MYKFQERCWFKSRFGTLLLLEERIHLLCVIIHQLTIGIIFVYELHGNLIVLLFPIIFGAISKTYSHFLSNLNWKQRIILVFFISMLFSFYFFTISTHELSNIRGVMCICIAIIFTVFNLCVGPYKTISKSPTRSKFISDMLTQNEIADAYVQRSLPLRLMQYYQNGVVPSLIFSAYNGLFESSYQYFGFAIMNLSFMFIFSLIVLFFGFRPANHFGK